MLLPEVPVKMIIFRKLVLRLPLSKAQLLATSSLLRGDINYVILLLLVVILSRNLCPSFFLLDFFIVEKVSISF